MSDSLIVLLPTTQAMAMMLTCSVSGRFGDRYGPKPFIGLGCIASIAAVAGCAFGDHVRHLYTTQAVQGIGAGLVYPPCMSIVTRSWKHRAFLATSFLLACIPLYAFVAVLCSRALLTAVDHRQTLLIFSGIHGVLLFSSLFGLYNAPPPKRSSSITWVDGKQIRDKRFWLLGLSIMFTAFAMLPPFAFLTIYTRQIVPGISPQMSVIPLALVNLTAVFGRAIAAFLIRPFAPGLPKHVSFGDDDDHHHWRLAVEPRRAFAGAILLAALSQLIWAFATSYSQLVAYACINGLFGVTFLSILPTLSAVTFPKVDKAAAVGCLVLFATPGQSAPSSLSTAELVLTVPN
ncbi:hypothetical protein M407DRAFT_18451 [Tulasnella calospora MUT 4182]|uniref:Major facilitator superfamily (MFS) profile domain-containing protein n=1 Tax=Tulasnella calospora MUT 4182 TaxID=1051891 RepID=A0A0C3QTU8_9AGAM|nr:hypothetical protein M407DRAFT_18451 [Tulasnella calospora MUT 4182]